MKKIISAALVFAVVGSALAFKTKLHPDIFKCNTTTFLCEKYPNGFNYSSQTGSQTNRPSNPYKGNLGDDCSTSTSPCTPYAGQIFIND